MEMDVLPAGTSDAKEYLSMDDESGKRTAVLKILELPTTRELAQAKAKGAESTSTKCRALKLFVALAVSACLWSAGSLISRMFEHAPMSERVASALASTMAFMIGKKSKHLLDLERIRLVAAEERALIRGGTYFQAILPQAERGITDRFTGIISEVGAKLARIRAGIEAFENRRTALPSSNAATQEKERFTLLIESWIRAGKQTEGAYLGVMESITALHREATEKLSAIRLHAEIIPATEDIDGSLDHASFGTMLEVLGSITESLHHLDLKVKSLTEPKVALALTELEVDATKFQLESGPEHKLLPPA